MYPFEQIVAHHLCTPPAEFHVGPLCARSIAVPRDQKSHAGHGHHPFHQCIEAIFSTQSQSRAS